MVRYGTSVGGLLSQLAARAKALRLAENLTQQQLAARAGVGVMTVKRFEASGLATLENVVRMALALRAEQPLDALFERAPYASIDDAIAAPTKPRRRVRRGR